MKAKHTNKMHAEKYSIIYMQSQSQIDFFFKNLVCQKINYALRICH